MLAKQIFRGDVGITGSELVVNHRGKTCWYDVTKLDRFLEIVSRFLNDFAGHHGCFMKPRYKC